MVNPNYQDFVMRHVRTQTTPRTQSEAFRDADYGTAIWRCETTNERAMNGLLWIVTVLFTGFVLGLFVAPIVS